MRAKGTLASGLGGTREAGGWGHIALGSRLGAHRVGLMGEGARDRTARGVCLRRRGASGRVPSSSCVQSGVLRAQDGAVGRELGSAAGGMRSPSGGRSRQRPRWG